MKEDSEGKAAKQLTAVTSSLSGAAADVDNRNGINRLVLATSTPRYQSLHFRNGKGKRRKEKGKISFHGHVRRQEDLHCTNKLEPIKKKKKVKVRC